MKKIGIFYLGGEVGGEVFIYCNHFGFFLHVLYKYY